MQQPNKEYIIAAFSAASWYPQNIKFFLPMLWIDFHNLGRKNYLFAGSNRGAERAAMMYSFFATCSKNEVNPYQWLKTVLEVIPTYKVNRLTELLPQNLEL